MIGLLCFVVAVLASAFKSKIRLEAENATLRHQLVVLRRKMKGHAHLTNHDRWFLVQMYRWFPLILEVVTIVRPETLVHKITGRGLFTIDRKYKTAWTGTLPVKLLLVSNLMPKLGDDSAALASRFISFVTRISFYGR